MKPAKLIALDFDGVICDSAIETAMTAWKAAGYLWNEMNNSPPSSQLIEQFRQVRPRLKTGYEAILIVRLLQQGECVETLLTDYRVKQQQAIESSKQDIAGLKQLFGQTRDLWIDQDKDHWLKMNPLFLGVAKKLQALNQQQIPWSIITTKQERFVSQILAAYEIKLPYEKIFGLDRNLSKETVLIDLLGQYPQHEIHFVEDRLPTLMKVMAYPQLHAVKLFFATWGYNTHADKIQAIHQPRIESITLPNFLA